jgi:HSP20 family protein
MLFHVSQGTRPHTRYGSDPFAIVQRALERGFSEGWSALTPSPTEAKPLSVRLDVKEDEKAFHVTADLPGLTEKDVDVTFDEGVLTIRGEKKIEREEKQDTWHVVERSQGSFARQVSLPTTIDADKIEAVVEKGVLKVTMPKQPVEPASSKKINVKAG